MNEQIFKARLNTTNILSINDFINYNGGVSDNYKDVCFVRAVGVNNFLLSDIQKMDESLEKVTYSEKGLYIRTSGLPKILSFNETDYYSECYQEWIDSNKTLITIKSTLDNLPIQKLLSVGCNAAVAVFEKTGLPVNSSIIKNFVVKMMFWFDNLFNSLLKNINQNSTIKIVAENITKKHEYFFFYMLAVMGLNVLLIQSNCDINNELEKLNLSEKFVLGNLGNITISKYIPQKSYASISDGYNPSKPANNSVVSCNNQFSQNSVSTSTVATNGNIVMKIPERNRSKSKNNNTKVNNVVATSVPPIQNSTATGGNIKMKIPERNRGNRGNINTGRNTFPNSIAGNISGYPSQPLQNSSYSQQNRTQEKNYEELASLAKSVVMIGIHDKKGEMIGSGSGIMISPNGYILTNNHVASGGCFYSVRIEDDDEIYTSYDLIKYNQLLDLAVLRIDRKLNPIPVYRGNKNLVRGQKVVAIGSPLGLFNSVSDGIIAGFRNLRDIEMIQFTAPISSGSSGGAVLNMYGEVIGISTAGIDEGQNINLAVGYKYINPFIQGFI